MVHHLCVNDTTSAALQQTLNDRLTHAIIGAAIQVNKRVGVGLLESAYETFLCHELQKLKLDTSKQPPMPVVYDDVRVELGYRPDIIVESRSDSRSKDRRKDSSGALRATPHVSASIENQSWPDNQFPRSAVHVRDQAVGLLKSGVRSPKRILFFFQCLQPFFSVFCVKVFSLRLPRKLG